MTIRLFTVPEDQNTDIARAELRKLRDVTIREAICPPAARDIYLMPYIKVEPTGGRFFGVEDIREFVTTRLAGSNINGRLAAT